MFHIFKSSKLPTIKEGVAVCLNKLTRFIDRDKNIESKTRVFTLPLILIVHLLWRSMYSIIFYTRIYVDIDTTIMTNKTNKQMYMNIQKKKNQKFSIHAVFCT